MSNCLHIPGVPVQQPPAHRMPVIRAVNGDEIRFSFTARHPDGTPATPDNSIVMLSLAENRFICPEDALWVAGWEDGLALDPTVEGLVQVVIPSEMSATLRRGSYAFSAAVSGPYGVGTNTVASGYIQIEYEPTSPNHNIPYRRACQ